MHQRQSRLPGFYRLSVSERRHCVRDMTDLPAAALAALDGGLELATADHLIENVIGTYALPFAVALNFRVNGRELLVPMVVEEPSVVAASSYAARMARDGGGFSAETDPPIMVAQVQLLDVSDPDGAAARIGAATADLLAQGRALLPRLCERGGGPVGVTTRVLSRPGAPDGGMVVVHLAVDCRDAMGANLLNTLAEALAPALATLAGPGTRVGLRILTNLADQRLVRVRVRVPLVALECQDSRGQGAEIAAGIAAASRFAELDPYRAATHNKGIMNGVDAVLLATGNDWRSVEAGAHAFAARGERYAPLAIWRAEADALTGQLEMPMAVGVVGGALNVHPTARLGLKLARVGSAAELAAVAGAAGLATNLAALRALATSGIQRGHMALHARSVARAAGAEQHELDEVATAIAAAGDVKLEHARRVLADLRAQNAPLEAKP